MATTVLPLDLVLPGFFQWSGQQALVAAENAVNIVLVVYANSPTHPTESSIKIRV